MQTYNLDPKTVEQLTATVDNLTRCFDVSTDYGRVLCGIATKAALPWDASPNWELRHKPPTDALLIEGLPVSTTDGDIARDPVYLVALMTGMMRGSPWAWGNSEKSVFVPYDDPEEYAKTEGARGEDLGAPRVALGGTLACTPETILVSTVGSRASARIGWMDSRTLTEGMPRKLLLAASEPWYSMLGESGHPSPILVPSELHGAPPRLVIGTSAVAPVIGAPPAAIGALEYLRAYAAEGLAWVNLQPGQAIVLPNTYGVHAIQWQCGGAVRRIFWNRDLREHRARCATHGAFRFANPAERRNLDRGPNSSFDERLPSTGDAMANIRTAVH